MSAYKSIRKTSTPQKKNNRIYGQNQIIFSSIFFSLSHMNEIQMTNKHKKSFNLPNKKRTLN